MKTNNSILYGAILILLGIILGAMGTHAFKPMLSPNQFLSFEIAVRYQFYSGFSLLFFGLAQQKNHSLKLNAVVLTQVLGVLLFSGSIYGLVFLADSSGLKRILGPTTPIGGSLMIFSWFWFIVAWIRNKNLSHN